MKILLTGAAGFIGSNLYKSCLNAGWEIEGVDDLSNGHLAFLHPEEVAISICDFTNEAILDDIRSKKYDAVIHLAAVPRVSYSVEHPLETNDTNVSKTLVLMQACVGNVKRFVFASSSSVYGGADAGTWPTHESFVKQPKSPYALQKSIIEDYLAMYGELYGLDSVCLRFFNVFGPNQLGDSPYATALGAWLTAIKRGMPMRSDGTGEQSRDLCHVKNVVSACMKACVPDKRWVSKGRCYNVACGKRVTNAEVLEYLMQRYPGSTKYDAPWRPGDVMHTLADVARAKEEIGYVPIVDPWDGIKDTCDWYDANWEWAGKLKLNK